LQPEQLTKLLLMILDSTVVRIRQREKKTQNILIIFELLTLQDKASLGLVDGAARRCVGSVCYVFFFFYQPIPYSTLGTVPKLQH